MGRTQSERSRNWKWWLMLPFAAYGVGVGFLILSLVVLPFFMGLNGAVSFVEERFAAMTAIFAAIGALCLLSLPGIDNYSSRREKGWQVHIVLLGSRLRKAWLYVVLAGKNLVQAFGLKSDDAPRMKNEY